MAVLDEHVTLTQAMQFSAFKGPFEERIEDWNRKILTISDVLEQWLAVQRGWLYLEPIFASADIKKQLPNEAKKFATVDKNWKQTISAAKNDLLAMNFCDNLKLLERFNESAALLDEVAKGLSDYLESKRGVFARFYFLSDEDLLLILSESKDVEMVTPHFKKCFEAIATCEFAEDKRILSMTSPEGERVPFSEVSLMASPNPLPPPALIPPPLLSQPVDPNEKSVEVWLLEIERAMRVTLRDHMTRAIETYTTTPRTQWMQQVRSPSSSARTRP